MSPLTIKRIIVWVVSIVLGFLTASAIIGIGFGILPSISPVLAQGISIEKYGTIYFLTTMLPLTLIYVVWLDYFLGAKILPD